MNELVCNKFCLSIEIKIGKICRKYKSNRYNVILVSQLKFLLVYV